MEFTVKGYGGDAYKELIINDRGATMESGLLDDSERRKLADELQSAIDDLLSGLEVAS